MITAIILANEDQKALMRTLNALIGATVDGLVREVVLLGDAAHEATASLADEAGCSIAAPLEFAALLKTAKGQWLLILEAGALPEQGWAEAVGNHIQQTKKAGHFTRSPLAKRGLFKRFLQRELPLALGLLVEKHAAIAIASSALLTPEVLAKAARPSPISAALRPALDVHPSAA